MCRVTIHYALGAAPALCGPDTPDFIFSSHGHDDGVYSHTGFVKRFYLGNFS